MTFSVHHQTITQRQIQRKRQRQRQKDKDKDKDKNNVQIGPNMCYIFEKPRAQGC